MIVAFTSANDNFDRWAAPFRRLMPEIEWRIDPALGDPSDIEAALVWRPVPGWLAKFPNLRLILSQGAGVDHILTDPSLPRHVPIVRLVDPYMTRSMVEYVTFQVLRLHLRAPELRRRQQERVWHQHVVPVAPERRVGILGLGELGAASAAALVALGFDVAGWSRSPKAIPKVASYSGASGYQDFLARSEILVCLLPLTPETRGILGAATFDRLPRGAGIINAGRGGHLVEADLLAALADGRVGEAVLDVFETEPLPADHCFWTHPRIVVTPHIAAMSNPATAAEAITANLRRLARGEAFPDQIDPATGY